LPVAVIEGLLAAGFVFYHDRWEPGVVRFVTSHCDLPVIGVGGISDARDGLRMLDAGASLLQIYTGFIYSGPPLLAELNRAIATRNST